MAAARGEVWYVDLNPVRGHEQAGIRPALVISADEFNRGPAGLVIVVPLTTRERPRPIPLHVPIEPRDGGVRQRSFAMCDQVRTISVERLERRLGLLSREVMGAVDDRLRIVLSL